jgi:PAS domain S-box-containing protein
MHLLREMSISSKLKLVIMVTTSVALLLACAAFVTYDLISERRSMAGDLSSLAKVIGTNSSANLAFSGSNSAKDLLTGLSAKQNIAAAWISLDTGEVFAEYVRDRGFVPPDPGQQVYGSQFYRGYLIACEPIVLDSKIIGWVCLVSDVNALRDRIAQYCVVVVMILFASLLVAFLLSSRLQRMISGRISHLARTVRAVSDEKDYTIRATKHGRDELGTLIDGFNEMLSQIQERDAKLQTARDELELRVEERTKELKVEIAERERIEKVLRRSEEYFRSLIENATDVITVLDLDGTIRYESPSVERVMGYKPEELIGRNANEFTHPDDDPATSVLMAQVSKPGDGSASHEVRFKHRSGEWRTLEVFERLIRDESGVAQVIINSRDITDRKGVAESLKESETLFRSLAETVSAAIYIYHGSKFIYVNPAAESITGYTHDELMGMEIWDILHPDFVEDTKERAARRQRGEDIPAQSETKILTKNGEARWLDLTPRLIRFQGQQAVLATAFDVTERKGWEETLREGEEKYRTILQSIQEGYFEVDLRGNLTFFNDSMCRIIGSPAERLMGLNNRQYSDAETARRLYAAYNQVYQTGEPLEGFQHKIITRNGSEKFLESSILLKRDSTGQISGFRGTVRDITERKRSEEALQESEERYRLLFERNLAGVYRSAPDGALLECNEAAARILGYDSAHDALSHSMWEFYYDPVERQALAQRLLKERSISNLESRARSKEGKLVWVLANLSLLDGPDGTPAVIEGTLIDITASKQAEVALRESEERYKALFEAATDAIMILDTEGSRPGQIVAANRAAAETTGYTVDELLNLNIAELRVPEQANQLFNDIERVLNGKTGSVEIYRRRKDGSSFPVEVNASLVSLGDKPHILLFGRDMTQRKQMEKEAAMLAHTVRSIQESVSITDTDHHVVFVNDAFVKTYGFERDEVLGKRMIDLVRVKSESTDPENALLGPGPEQLWEGELLNRRKDGTVFPINLCVSPIYDDSGQMIALAGIVQDITERKKIEKEVSMLAHAIRSVHEAVTVTDLKGNIIFVNDAAVKGFGYTRDEALGQHVSIFNSIQSSATFVNEVITSAEVGHWEGEMLSRRKDGTEFPIFLSASDIKDETGQPIAIVGVSQDITERRRAIQELQKAKEIAEAASSAKSEFLANMSHEIRTPMNGIIGMTELALDTELSAEQSEYLTLVKLSADSLLGVINDILDFSKIEAGKLDLDLEEFNLLDCVDEVMKALSIRADQKSLELAYYLRPGVPEFIVGDRGRLQQILVNLVGNAIKFTERGEVIVRVEAETHANDEVLLHFNIRDTGIGVPPEKQKIIFESFTQADGSTTRKYGGTGLGLAISSQLVDMMGGQIWIECPVVFTNGIVPGSIFHFTSRFLIARDLVRSEREPHLADLTGLQVLVVDDNATNRRILEVQLTNWQMKPTGIDRPGAALDVIKQAAAAGTPFKLALLDFHMPEIDGLALAEQIKADPECSDLRIIIMSSSVQQNQARHRDWSIDAKLLKPVKAAELLSVIRDVMGGDGPSKPRKRQVGLKSTNPARVLLAEDNPVNQELIKRLLEKWGHSATVAHNGNEALALFDDEKFDCVLMDLQMPEINGFEATAVIRERELGTGKHIPIIALTAHALKGDRERCIEAGMDDYISKPIEAAKLFDIIEAAVNQSHIADETVRPAIKVFETDALINHYDGDVGLVVTLAAIFADSSTVQLSEIADAISRGDSTALAHSAHALRGSVANFHAQAAVDAAATLERMARSGELAMASSAFAVLKMEIHRLKEALETLEEVSVS